MPKTASGASPGSESGPGVRFTGPVYRAHNPEWAWDPLSGDGARLHGGRFNRQGALALYTSLTVIGAVREVSPLGKPFHPITLCQYAVDCDNILDTRDPAALAEEGLEFADLECPTWRSDMFAGRTPASHDAAEKLGERGYAGLIVKSFAIGAGAEEFNLVLWRWSKRRPHKVVVVDPQRRLPRDRASWEG